MYYRDTPDEVLLHKMFKYINGFENIYYYGSPCQRFPGSNPDELSLHHF